MGIAFNGTQVRPALKVTRTAQVRNEGFAYWADEEDNVIGISASGTHAMREAHVHALKIEKLEDRVVKDYGYYLVRRSGPEEPWIVVGN